MHHQAFVRGLTKTMDDLEKLVKENRVHQRLEVGSVEDTNPDAADKSGRTARESAFLKDFLHQSYCLGQPLDFR